MFQLTPPDVAWSGPCIERSERRPFALSLGEALGLRRLVSRGASAKRGGPMSDRLGASLALRPFPPFIVGPW